MHPMQNKPKISWRTYRVTAGTANFKTWTISLSVYVLQSKEQISTTVLHEYAHLLAYDRFGKEAANHGPHWKQAMMDLCLEPTRTHQYPVKKNRAIISVQYVCTKCGVQVIRRRRLPGGRIWLHKGCGGSVKRIH